MHEWVRSEAAQTKVQQEAAAVLSGAQAKAVLIIAEAQKEAHTLRVAAAPAPAALRPQAHSDSNTTITLNATLQPFATQPLMPAAERMCWSCLRCTFDNNVACNWCGMCGKRVQPSRGGKRPLVQPAPSIRTPTKRARAQSDVASSCPICLETLSSDCSVTQCRHSFCTL